jgi:SAM-dependent methyltransferase
MSASVPRTCPQCGGASSLRFAVGDLNRHLGSELFDYYRCADCSLLFLDPLPADLGHYYPQDYYALPQSIDEVARNARHEAYKIDIVRKHIGGGRLIEIGPATGGFCYLAKQAGFQVQAIEMDRRCSEFLRSMLHIDVVNSAAETAALDQLEPADVVALWHVIEHLRDPWGMLEAIARKLRPGGIAVIATPNPDALQFRIWGKRWVHVDAPRHVVLIPADVMTRRMRELDLDLVEMTTNDEGGLGWNWFGWVYGFANFSAAPRIKRFLRLAGRMVRRAVAPLEDREGKGAAYTAVFRKAAR